MIKNEEYMEYLKKMISCVSYGDYYSVKELSALELDTLKQNTNTMKKELNKYVKKNKSKVELKKMKNNEIIYFVNTYIEYIFKSIKDNKKLKEIASIEEFIQEIK